MSVAFTKEESAETASETLLPDRPISPHPNLVTATGLKALTRQLEQAREALEVAQKTEDVNERRRLSAIPLRDVRYFSERVRTAQLVPDPASSDVVAFGSTVTFARADGRVQTYRIVGEDEADPKAGSISFASPVARSLMGKAVGDVLGAGNQELRDPCDRVSFRDRQKVIRRPSPERPCGARTSESGHEDSIGTMAVQRRWLISNS